MARARIASTMSTPNVAARPEMAEVGDEQEQENTIALARMVSMVWYTILWNGMIDACLRVGSLKGSLTTAPTCKLSVHTPIFDSLRLYSALATDILVKDNQSSSKAARAAEILDFFLAFLEEPSPKLTNSLSGASGGGSGAQGRVSSSIMRSNLSLSERLGLTDPSVDDLASSSNDSLDASSESLDSPFAESLLNSGSD